MEEKETPLTPDEFERLWKAKDFKEVVRESATGTDPLRYRRIVIEARVAQAQFEMVRWTKYAVFAAVGAAIVSLALGIAAVLD